MYIAIVVWSNNSAVVLAAAVVHWIMAPVEDLKRIVKPLLFVPRSSDASKYVCRFYVTSIPSLFSPYFEDFFICSSDSYQIKVLKLDILAYIATDSSISFILKRISELTTGEFRPVDAEAGILIQAIMSIKSIIQQDPPSHEKVIIQLVQSLTSIKVPAARAMIVWMVGEYNSLGDLIPRMLATVLKYLARCFASEEVETKLQICNTAVKVLLGTKGNYLLTIKMVLIYVLKLAKCDLNYDVRDRAHF